MRRIVIVLLIVGSLVGYRLYSTGDLRQAFDIASAGQALSQGPATNATAWRYPEIPREEILTTKTDAAARVTSELQARYMDLLREFQAEVRKADAHLVVVFLTPEVRSARTLAQRKGRPVIFAACQELGIEAIDLTEPLEDAKGAPITQMPRDGHWSRAGAQIIANELASIVKEHDAHRATVTYPASERPPLLGDLEPNSDEVLDGGKDLPYRVKTNSQGLRIDIELEFPKTRQRILLMGDSAFYFPFLDNPDTGTARLQALFPEKEIVNTAMWGYSIDDYVSQFREKARYIEPDVVILETNGNDILDLFFSHRNRFSRSGKEFKPDAAELAFYSELYDTPGPAQPAAGQETPRVGALNGE